MALLKPKEITIIDLDGVERLFLISRFPATDGMEILVKLPMSAMPKIGDFETLKAVRDDIFKFIAVKTELGEIVLSTKALIDNHTNDAETAIKLMKEIIEYNFSFFQNGIVSSSLTRLMEKIPSVAQSILTRLLEALSKPNKRR